MTKSREIWCCGCEKKVHARLTNGAEIYPHRGDLAAQPFWRCDGCGNYVGCHHKHGTAPLGCIPTPELRKARGHIHAILDPLWKSKKIGRSEIYAKLTEITGRRYHTAHIRSVEEAREIYRHVQEIAKEMRA